MQSPPDWAEILVNFRGSELQNFFTKLLEDDIKVSIASLRCLCLCLRFLAGSCDRLAIVCCVMNYPQNFNNFPDASIHANPSIFMRLRACRLTEHVVLCCACC